MRIRHADDYFVVVDSARFAAAFARVENCVLAVGRSEKRVLDAIAVNEPAGDDIVVVDPVGDGRGGIRDRHDRHQPRGLRRHKRNGRNTISKQHSTQSIHEIPWDVDDGWQMATRRAWVKG